MSLTITGKFFSKFFVSACNKELDIQGGTVKVTLHDSGYTPDFINHQYYDVSASHEIVDGAYAAFTLSTPALSVDGTTGAVKFTAAANATWPGNLTACRTALFHDDAPSSNKPLVGALQFSEDVIIETLRWNTNGILLFTP